MAQVVVNGTNSLEVNEQIQEGRKEMNLSYHLDEFALVVSGEAFLRISNYPEMKEHFLEIAERCSVVLACRVSPKQKAEIVQFIREKYPTTRTLAIGDGANDVNMITQAHVGVGISGLEGQQASRAADYSIG